MTHKGVSIDQNKPEKEQMSFSNSNSFTLKSKHGNNDTTQCRPNGPYCTIVTHYKIETDN